MDFEIEKLLEANTNTFESLFPTIEKEKITVELDEKLNSINPRNIQIKKHGVAQPKYLLLFSQEQIASMIR
ncbi:hypothetical protein [Chryseobacterium indoltheticum]|uniref:hypothetical protein n=1 Tax=Chryseobacterium indoltheticum TaxID=254 RepID=UPI003F493B27